VEVTSISQNYVMTREEEYLKLVIGEGVTVVDTLAT
jgi:hypothetical protein